MSGVAKRALKPRGRRLSVVAMIHLRKTSIARLLLVALFPFMAACGDKSGGNGSSAGKRKPAGSATPEEAFRRMKAALAARDWSVYWDVHAEEALPGLFLIPEMSTALADQGLKDSTDALRKKHRAGIPPKGVSPLTAGVKELYPDCPDLRAWFIDFMGLVSANPRASGMLEVLDVELSDVRVEGDLATGLITSKKGTTWRKRFLRVEGLWLIGSEAKAIVDAGTDPAGPRQVLERLQAAIAARNYEDVYDRIDPEDRDAAIGDVIDVAWTLYSRAHQVPEAGMQFSERIARLTLGETAPTGSAAQTWLGNDSQRFAAIKDKRALFVVLARHLDETTPQPAESWTLAIRPDFMAPWKFTEVRIQGLAANVTIRLDAGFERHQQLVNRDGTWYFDVRR